MSELYEAAKDYLAEGWYIIPLVEGQKTPAVQWNQFRSTKPTEAQLRDWFIDNNYNVGIITGGSSRLVVVDIDDDKAIIEWAKQYDSDRVSVTARGLHFFYRVTGRKSVPGNSAGKLGKKIDTRGTGGYVVAPPSVVNGHKYKWHGSGEARELPEELLKKLTVVTIPSDGMTIEQRQDGVQTLLSIMRKGFDEGRHNEQTKDAARYLFRSGMNTPSIIAVLRQLNRLDPTPLPDDELRATIKSGIGYEERRLKEGREDDAPEEPFRLLSLGQVYSEYAEYEHKWLLQDWLPEEAIVSIVAAPESYKTWIALDAALSVALGPTAPPFLGVSQVNEAHPVLIVQQEDGVSRIKTRIDMILRSKLGDNIVPDSLPVFVHPDSNLRFENKEAMLHLERAIREHGIKLVMLDPFYWLAKADENFFAEAVNTGLPELKRMRSLYGVSFLIVHHSRKSGGDGRERMYGSQLLNAAFEGMWNIDNERLTVSGKVFDGKAHYTLNTDIEDGVYNINAAVGREFVTKAQQEILDVLSGGPKTQSSIAKEVGKTSGGIKKSIESLVNADLISKTGRTYSLVDDTYG